MSDETRRCPTHDTLDETTLRRRLPRAALRGPQLMWSRLSLPTACILPDNLLLILPTNRPRLITPGITNGILSGWPHRVFSKPALDMIFLDS